MSGGKKKRQPVLPYVLPICLLIALIGLALQTENINRQYRIEASYTTAPAGTPRLVTVTAEANQTASTPKKSLLMMDSIGREVKELQQRLKDLGYYSGAIDGIFGIGTLGAVKSFQEQNGLDADGLVGSITEARLFSDMAVRFAATTGPAIDHVIASSFPPLVNRDYPLAESYVPEGLVYLEKYVPAGLMIIKYKDIRATIEAVNALIALIQKAVGEGLGPWQVSAGYRSFDSQKELFENRKQAFIEQGFNVKNATSATRKTVADPGTSEHQTGLAFDITVPGYNFEDTPQSDWLAIHCWEYGFIIRYTDEKQGITGFLGEPWHVRYVGLPFSMDIFNKKLCLEEYLAIATSGQK